MSALRKARVRSRLREVDSVIGAIKASGVQLSSLDKALLLPKESQMKPKDKYTTFSPSSKGHRKSVHKVPHFTKLTLRQNPKGF